MSLVAIEKPLMRFDRLLQRWFPRVGDLDREARRAALARIAVGLILAFRTALLAWGTSHDIGAQSTVSFLGVSIETLLAIAWCGLSLLLAAGLCTPAVLAALILCGMHVDRLLHSYTLGTCVATVMLVSLFACNAGLRFSLDAYLLPSRSTFGRAIRWLYGVWGRPSAEDYRLALGYGFGSFALLHLLALGYHLGDPYWIKGITVGLIHTNPYLCRVPGVFRSFEAFQPELFRAWSASAVIGQTVWQATMAGLLGIRGARLFTIGWGICFVLGSLVFLQISYLPFFELMLWFWLFWPRTDLSKDPALARPKPGNNLPDVGTTRRALFAVFFLCSLTAGVLSTGYVRQRLPFSLPSAVTIAANTLGMDAPNVFNMTDLGMGDHWFRVQRLGQAGEPGEFVPLSQGDGGRGPWFFFDNLYFGTDLRWRRAQIGRKVKEFNAPGSLGDLLIRRVIAFDWSWSGRPTLQLYRVVIYSSPQSTFGSPLKTRYSVTPVLELKFTASREGVFAYQERPSPNP